MSVPLTFVWPYALPFWAAVILVSIPETRLWRDARRAGTDRQPQDAGTTALIVYGTYVTLLAAIAAAFLFPAATFARGRATFFFAGLVLLIAGGWLRRHCFHVLGAKFTYAVQVSAGQSIVDSGAYRYLRHPSYLAGMLLYAGWGFALTNWVSLALLLVVPAALYAKRIAVEERALLDTLGSGYAEYMRRTKRIIPYLY